MSAENESREDEQKALHDLKQAEADMDHAEQEIREAERELEEARKDHDVTIVVDGTEHRLERRRWIVRELKARLKIDPAKVLAKITPHGLEDLDDNKEIELHNREQFMTHARTGGSS